MYKGFRCHLSVANSKWGADKFTLLHLYHSLVRSKVSYGCIVYRTARTSYLIYMGAFRTSSVDSLYVETNEPPLDISRLKLALQNIVKLKANTDNPAFDCVFHQ